MIRPVTIATFLMACGSGLYLYQSKHQVQLLDREIEHTVHETAALREQSRNLATEWTMLNDPERLRQFSDAYLHLKSIDPKQFTSLAELGNRLPPVAPAEPAPGAAEPVADASDDNAVADAASAADAGSAEAGTDILPTPPLPAAMPVVAYGAVRPADKTPGDRASGDKGPADRAQDTPRPTLADVQPTRPLPADSHVAEPHPVHPAEGRPEVRSTEVRSGEAHPSRSPEIRPVELAASRPGQAVPRPTVLLVPRGPQLGTGTNAHAGETAAARAALLPPPQARQPVSGGPQPRAYAAFPPARPAPPTPAVVPAAAPYGGSLLGMAHGAASSAPRPTPITYNAN